MKYRFNVNFDRLSLLSDSLGYTGNLDTYDCGFIFSEEWTGYEKFITVIQDDTTYTDKLTGDKYVLPSLKAGEISVGLFGTRAEEEKRICTNLLVLKYENGAYSESAPPVPAPDVWLSYVNELTEKFNEKAEEVTSLFEAKTLELTEEFNAKGTEMTEAFEAKKAELEESFEEAANEIMDAKVPIKATEAQALEGTDDSAFITPLQGKNQFGHLLAASLINTPEFYTKETVEGMYAINGMKHGDMCIILSNDATAQSIYRYYTKDISGGDLTSPQWLWVTDLSLFAPQPVLDIPDDNIWDFSKGNTARMTIYPSYSGGDNIYPDEDDGLMDGVVGGDDDIIQWFTIESNPYITITNVYSGAFGVLDVYGRGELILPDNSYSPPPDWDYLKPEENQHYRYTFYYDGTKFDWNRSVRNDF